MAQTQISSSQRIRTLDLTRVFLRSFFVQSVWNYRSLISIGFGICLMPIIDRLYSDPQQKKAFLKRHMQFFNAHPYLVSYALGVTIRLEEAAIDGDATASRKLGRLKELLISILGALGDQLFWSTIKPSSLILGVCLLSIASPDPAAIFAALTISFLAYNIPHVYMRWHGLTEGYLKGLEVAKSLNQRHFRRLKNAYRAIGLVAFLLFFIILISNMIQQHPAQLILIGGCILSAFASFHLTHNLHISILLSLTIGMIVSIFFI